MSDDAGSGTLAFVLRAFARALEPLEQAAATADGTRALLAALGVDPRLAPPSLLALHAPLTEVATAVAQLATTIAAEGAGSDAALSRLGELSIRTAFAAEKILSLKPALEADFAGQQDVLDQIDFGLVARRLLDLVLVELLRREFPPVYGTLLLTGVIHIDPVTPGETATASWPHLRTELRWERLKTLVTDPGGLAREVYGWGTDDFDDHELLERLRYLLQAFGLLAAWVEVDVVAGIDAAGSELRLPLYADLTETGSIAVSLGLVPLAPRPAVPGKRLGLRPVLDGTAEIAFELRPKMTLALKAAFDVDAPFALVLAPPGDVEMVFGIGSPSAALVATLDAAPESGARLPLVAIPDWFLLDAAGVRASVALALATTGVTPTLEAGFVGTRLKIEGSKADGFLRKILPEQPIEATFDAIVGWSPSKGLYLGSGGGSVGTIAVALPLHLSLFGVITLETLRLTMVLDGGSVLVTAAADLGAKIGPVGAAVEDIGARLTLRRGETGGNLGPATLALDFKPPKGAGLSVKAGPVTGAGYLFFDPDNEDYAGVLELAFKAISVTAIGLITTRLPDASGPPGAKKKGFSLLVIIAIELPPIQLGYGFTLNGVGGLLGINRSMQIEPLRSGVRDGSVNSILFPKDVVARAPQIIAQLKAIFPPADGRYVFGPMVKIGWGPNAILELEAAVVLELMSPIRLVVLGRIQAALPDKDSPILKLRLDIVGVVDFDKGEVSVDASLVDSRLVVFVLTGDMALRVGWGASKMFALAAGGFHPQFQPPPGFPALRRLAIALADSDNPRLRLETYLALTANTVQLGALLDVYAKTDTFVGTFSVAVKLGFDALVQFQPFELRASLGALIDIARNDEPFIHAQLQADLTGPNPWRLLGYAEFDFLGRHRVDIDATVGQAAPPPVPRIGADEVLAKLAEAFARRDAWAALPPGEAERVVGLADGSGDGGDVVLVHPLGALGARQRVLPLGTVCDRFGTAILAPTTFALTRFAVGAGALAAPAAELTSDFSPGQFKVLRDDERVARPAFEPMPAGGTVPVPAFRVPADLPGGVTLASGWREAVIDVEPATGQRAAAPLRRRGLDARRVRRTMPGGVTAALTAAGSAGDAATRATGATRYRGPGLAVGVRGERYLATDPETLQPLPGAAPGSSAVAHDRVAQSGPRGQVSLAHES